MSDPLASAQADLNHANDQLRRVRMGQPLALTDGVLAMLADVGAQDEPAAVALWRAANPGPLGALLDAETHA